NLASHSGKARHGAIYFFCHPYYVKCSPAPRPATRGSAAERDTSAAKVQQIPDFLTTAPIPGRFTLTPDLTPERRPTARWSATVPALWTVPRRSTLMPATTRACHADK